MKISELDPDHLTDDQITALLYKGIADDKQNGDCVFLFGSSKAVDYRLPMAIKLYEAKRTGKLLFSGGVTWEGHQEPEAIQLKQRAIELGIPERDILVETQSKHTKENVLASLLVLDRAFSLHQIKRVLMVTAGYHMRRAFLTAKTYMPEWIDYSLCPVNDRYTRKNNWFLNKYGRKRVETEAKKLIRYVQQGVICDADLPIKPF
ncbi:hypothetical protein GCM10011391_16120 [Pullulanibacillus camelliae]|uniref:DUF218 domain-containing protein n=1 Tax=Pullulanibacillus camelliae TaxID=1707096 RepID=A0A8J2VQP0_9BACL|nr:YdcF family protein [Pullulanibacillus camelliae]GGE38085.1 hypothetical protein GCM10011391_16120 [Pullulanibacillus camelliae]